MLRVTEYEDDIFYHLRDLEQQHIVKPYMDFQQDLQWHMRSILIDWLVQVHLRFHMVDEVLFHAVNIMDRFLSIKVVAMDKFQLLGIVSLFIASKYEEERPPSLSDLVTMVDRAYSAHEILGAEKFVLGLLNYNLSYAHPQNFIRRISQADELDVGIRTVAKYFTEVTLMHEQFFGFANSLIAAGAMYLARQMIYGELPQFESWVSLASSSNKNSYF